MPITEHERRLVRVEAHRNTRQQFLEDNIDAIERVAHQGTDGSKADALLVQKLAAIAACDVYRRMLQRAELDASEGTGR